MSWVFLAGNEVYKLKKPVRLPYLDFSSLERRREACRSELELNRRLAPDVYKRLESLAVRDGRLHVGGEGQIVDWLVVMLRLEDSGTLEEMLKMGPVPRRQIDDVIATLLRFYRRAARVGVPAATLMGRWQASLAANRHVLLDPRFDLPRAEVLRLDGQQRRFLRERPNIIRGRALHCCIVDGHGDLRPEHIWPGPPVRIIDCLEFDARLRAVDPLDDLAFLVLECERLGAADVARYIERRISEDLGRGFCASAFAFYRSYRAMLRARLAIAHLFEIAPRTPDKWRRLALSYLKLAANR